ncbi:MAG: glycosyltransferase [Bacteroides sp.]|jgi:glycosyltransferase|nr:glycosyltransferase [Bacteroides sp.]MCI1683212.1 glycosyltransferase [Bacteroides sp.]
MKVSIITSCYNREATIRNAIESVLAQDYPDIEYIIVDGASKDHSMEIVNEYRNRISKIISEPDHGMYEAINKGIRIATGDIIGLVHSDDMLYEKKTISHVVAEMERTAADFLYGNGIFVSSQDTTQIIRNWRGGHYSKRKIQNGWLPLHPTCYIKKKFLMKWGLYDESFKIAADTDLLVKLLYKENLRVSYLKEYIVRMRMGGLSTDRKKMKEKWNEDIRLYRNHGFNPYWALSLKIVSKIPQFIQAKFMNKKRQYS